jgi:hypothetical protein
MHTQSRLGCSGGVFVGGSFLAANLMGDLHESGEVLFPSDFLLAEPAGRFKQGLQAEAVADDGSLPVRGEVCPLVGTGGGPREEWEVADMLRHEFIKDAVDVHSPHIPSHSCANPN